MRANRGRCGVGSRPTAALSSSSARAALSVLVNANNTTEQRECHSFCPFCPLCRPRLASVVRKLSSMRHVGGHATILCDFDILRARRHHCVQHMPRTPLTCVSGAALLCTLLAVFDHSSRLLFRSSSALAALQLPRLPCSFVCLSVFRRPAVPTPSF